MKPSKMSSMRGAMAALLFILIISVSCAQPTPAATPTFSAPAPTDAPLPTLPASSLPGCFPGGNLHPKQDSMGDPYLPGLGNGGYDVDHYTLALNVSKDFTLLESKATINASATQDLTAFNLDLRGLNVKSVTVNSQAAQFKRSGIELAITPAEKLAKSSTFEVVVTYSGKPQPIEESPSMRMGWNVYKGGSYVASEPAGAFTWFPVNDHPCDKATYRMSVTVAKPNVVAANGTLKNVTDQGDARTYFFEENYPMASYLVTVNIGKFVEKTGKSPFGVPVRSYFDESMQNKISYYERTGEQIDFFSQLFGPYPFDAYGVMVVDAPLGFALETQTLSLFGQARTDNADYTDQVAAHELAHQWFGDSVSLKSWKDIWLNEGFATYAQWLWLDHRFGNDAMGKQARDSYQNLSQSNDPPPGDPGPEPNHLFGPSVYFRGALTLYALRARVGDEDFFAILREYAGRYAYGNAGTEDFIAVAEEISGQDLKSFFQGWLHDQKMPPFPG